MLLPPAGAERGVEAVVDGGRQFERLALPIDRDGLADVVDDHLARIAAGHVFLELGAEGRVTRPVDVFVEDGQQFFALHG